MLTGIPLLVYLGFALILKKEPHLRTISGNFTILERHVQLFNLRLFFCYK